MTNFFETHDQATRDLARSLLQEYLVGTRPPAGLARHTPTPRRRRAPWSHDAILRAIGGFLARTGRHPTRTEWHAAGEYGLPSPWTLRRHFGSVAACLVTAGRAHSRERGV